MGVVVPRSYLVDPARFGRDPIPELIPIDGVRDPMFLARRAAAEWQARFATIFRAWCKARKITFRSVSLSIGLSPDELGRILNGTVWVSLTLLFALREWVNQIPEETREQGPLFTPPNLWGTLPDLDPSTRRTLIDTEKALEAALDRCQEALGQNR